VAVDTIVLPVGHFLGPVFSAPDQTEPAGFEVRIADEVESLDSSYGQVWGLAHGNPGDPEHPTRDRAGLESDAAEAGVADPAAVVDGLLQRGLLAQLEPAGAAARSFAEQYNLFPLALGLGNTAERQDMFSLGMPEARRVVVGSHAYWLWRTAHRHRTLWDACENLGARPDPAELLSGFLAMVPVLLAGSCAYLDRVAPAAGPAAGSAVDADAGPDGETSAGPSRT
jgi:hypothetical protein